ncbi:hypothetical protein LX32DRAFT_61154 [Colletotrichum zoysiae]|uniref:C2H2-type domain-containing protein n=1 Tax=Colletotrichum zoysiae TaxID=1216348 RepID=A0AAD9HBT0_9PEZI|nr:hypothetical protein LX32DRAFT_61154 [Colletotrichum zoysiae]
MTTWETCLQTLKKPADPSCTVPATKDSSEKVEPRRWPSIDEESWFDSAIGLDHTSIALAMTESKVPFVLGSSNMDQWFVKNTLRRPQSKLDSSAGEAEMHSGPLSTWGEASDTPALWAESNSGNVDAGDEDAIEDDVFKMDLGTESSNLMKGVSPNFAGFQQHVLRLCPSLPTTNSYLVDRIAHQQTIRFKRLLGARTKHQGLGEDCPCGSLCSARGGHPILPRQVGDVQDIDPFPGSLEHGDLGHLEGYVNEESFPKNIPLPPTRNLPAKFECQLCFCLKKLNKPSDWTKHVHEDVQPFTCTWDRCREPKTFKRRADWVRHENEGHRHLEWWTCDVEDCRHTCYRRDNFLQHLVREHKFTEPTHKTKAAMRRAGSDPTWQKVEQCRWETSKRPEEEPCRFCGRQFPTWKKLTVHLAKHMEQISLPIIQLVEAHYLDLENTTSMQDQPQGAPYGTPEQPPTYPRSAVASLPTDSGYASVPNPKNPKTDKSFSYDRTKNLPISTSSPTFFMASSLWTIAEKSGWRGH